MGSMSQSNPFDQMADAVNQASQIQSNSIQQAMNISLQEYNASLSETQREFNVAQSDVQPYMAEGTTALNALYNIMGLQNPNTDQTGIAALYSQMNALQGLQNGEQGVINLLGAPPSNGSTLPSGYTGNAITGVGPGGNTPQYGTYSGTGDTAGQLAQYQQLMNAIGGTPTISYASQGVGGSSALDQKLNQAMASAGVPPQQVITYSPNANSNLDAIRNNPQLLGLWNSLGLPDISSPSPQSQLDAITQNPQYQFQMQQGQAALQNQAASQGNLNSGATLQALTQYGQGLASNSYSQRISQLMNMVNQGESAATFSSNQAQQQGQDVASLDTNLGNTLGSGVMAQGNVFANGLIGSQRWNILGNAYQQEQQNGMLSSGMGMLQNILGGMGGMGGGGAGMAGMMGMAGLKKGGKAKAGKTYIVGEIDKSNSECKK